MFYKQTSVKITEYGLAAGCQVTSTDCFTVWVNFALDYHQLTYSPYKMLEFDLDLLPTLHLKHMDIARINLILTSYCPFIMHGYTGDIPRAKARVLSSHRAGHTSRAA